MRTTRTRRTALTTLLGAPATGALLLASLDTREARAQTQSPFRDVPVTGPILDAAGRAVGTFTGALTVTQFAAQGDRLVALGTVSGTPTYAGAPPPGAPGALTDQAVAAPAAVQQAECTILTLSLGAIDLVVLGLHIHLDLPALSITADPGSLLGGLLCAIAGLSAGGAGPAALAPPLNQVVGLLG